jgi:hypothetical protein
VDDSARGENVKDVVARVGVQLELTAGLQHDSINSDAHPRTCILARPRPAEDPRQDRTVRMQQRNVGIAKDALDVLVWIEYHHYALPLIPTGTAPLGDTVLGAVPAKQFTRIDALCVWVPKSAVTSCGLRIFVDEAAESISS